MAYKFVRTSSQYVSASSAVVTDEPITLFVRNKPNNFASAGVVKALLWVGSAASTNNGWLSYEFESVLHAWQAGAGTAAQSFVGGVASNGVWATCTELFSSDSSRRHYTNTTAGTANTTSLTTSNANRTFIGAYTSGGSVAGYADNDLADAAVWSAVLNADEINSLFKGFKPTRIRPQSLVFYVPLIRDLNDIRVGLALTNNNTATVADHPRVY